ncbi:hypothetical protein [Acetomicrobium sp. S15 = DSM 107314]|uniref:hypothetical protein n=1 Tax=Acetomicrobium sp. S15 = DSM 107314 TaxID=2529858 RepID=UPI0018E167AA|nr:hypothetical protein [Acetomicrobium sp. S15 = DSM 107314]
MGEVEEVKRVQEQEDKEDGVASVAIPQELLEDVSCQLGISPDELAHVLANSSDTAAALSALRSIVPCYIAIKVKFESRRRGEVAGLFCVVADGLTGEVLDKSLWVGRNGLPEGFAIRASWESVTNAIRNVEEPMDNPTYKKVEKIFDALFTPTVINLLFRGEGKPENLLRIQEMLADEFHLDFIVDLELERFNRLRAELSKALPESESEGEPEEAREERDREGPKAESVQLFCKPYVDPVRGKAISDFSLGDLVEVSLDEGGSLARFVASVMAKSGQPAAFPVKAVERLPSGDYLVRLHISEGMEGIFKGSGEVRVKVLQPGRYAVPKVSPAFAVFIGIILLGILLLIFVIW